MQSKAVNLLLSGKNMSNTELNTAVTSKLIPFKILSQLLNIGAHCVSSLTQIPGFVLGF